ncbi:M20/M25/M40 family metallo-hydrolase [Amycolatopsis sp. NPDC005003]
MTTAGPRIAAYLDRELAGMVDELAEFVRIPAVAAEGGPALRRMAARSAEKCTQAGLETQVHDTAGHPVVLARGGPRDAPFTLLTYGHYDVFPVEGQPGWRTGPFEPVVTGDRMYGRGTGDNKGQFLAHLNALRWWHEEGGGLPIQVKVLLEGEEENGSRHLPDFVRAHRDELAADLCVYSDGPMLPGDRPALLFGARGGIALRFTSTGADRPLHSGNFGGVVPNPVLELSRFFAALVAPNGDLRIPGFEDRIPAAGAAERAALDALDLDLGEFRANTGVDPLPFRFGERFHDRLLRKPSLTVSGITVGGSGAPGLIPESATATGDLRLVWAQDPEEAYAALVAFAANGFSGIAVDLLFGQPPSRTPIDHPYADLVEEAVAEGFGRPPARVPSLAGTTPDHVFTTVLGLPAIMLPFAPADENHHGPNESMKLSLFRRGTHTVARLIEILAAHARPATVAALSKPEGAA